MQTSTKHQMDPNARRHDWDMGRRSRKHYRHLRVYARIQKSSMTRLSRRRARRGIDAEVVEVYPRVA